MNILLVGNGLNLALVNDPKKYDVLSKEISKFLKVIKFIKENEDITYENFNFGVFIKWLGPTSNNEKSKKIFELYKNIDSTLVYDLELLAQLFFSTKKFEMLNRVEKNKIKNWMSKTKEIVIKKISSYNDSFDKKIIRKINEKYQLIVTANYDENLESSGAENVYHAHGKYTKPDSIELITFKKYQSLLKTIKDKIDKKEQEKEKL